MSKEEIRTKGLKSRENVEFEKAIEAFTQLLNKYPEDQRVYIDLAICYRLTQKYEKALSAIDDLVSRTDVLDNWKELALKQRLIIILDQMESLLKRPLFGRLSEMKGTWLEFCCRNDQLLSSSIDRVSKINFLLAEANGDADVHAQTILVFLRQLDEATVANFRETITVIQTFYIHIGKPKMAEKFLDFLRSNDVVNLRAKISLGKFGESYAGISNDAIKSADEIGNGYLQAHACTHKLFESMMSFDLANAQEQVERLDRYFSSQSSELPTLHVIKKRYLDEMKQCIGYEEMQQSSEAGLHRVFLNVLSRNEGHCQKVIMSSYYLRLLIGKSNGTETVSTCFADAGRDKTIPKKIVQYWDSSTVPSDVLDCMRALKHATDGFDYQLFNKDLAAQFIRDNYDEEFLELFLRCEHPAIESDIFRVLYLYQCGGVWVDADDEFIAPSHDKSLESLIQQETLRVVSVISLEVQNNLIIVAPKNPVLGNIIADLNVAECSDTAYVWWNTGPGMFTYQVAYANAIASCIADDRLETANFKLLSSSKYNRLFRTPVLDYKSSELSWQKIAAGV